MKQQNPEPMVNNSNHVQIVMEVKKTDDLTLFKTIRGNRPPNPQHIKRLSDSIKKNGMLMNPILVNEMYEIIDGQHRLLAARDANTSIFFIVAKGYSIKEVHTLNLNQKNWTFHDYLDGYSLMGLPDYVTLKKFSLKHPYFNLGSCIAMCSNITQSSQFGKAQAQGRDQSSRLRRLEKMKEGLNAELIELENKSEVFSDGTWKVRDMEKAEKDAQKIKLIEPYYLGYNKSGFVGALLSLFQKPQFDFDEFMKKIKLQPTALVDCANRDQYRELIEDIYNFRRKGGTKVNLKY